jgi:hypothetical protein
MGSIPTCWKRTYSNNDDAGTEFSRILNDKLTDYKNRKIQFGPKRIDGWDVEVPISSGDCARQSVKQPKSGNSSGRRITRSCAEKG